MASKYSDIITLRESAATYRLQKEEEGAWKMFIANDQFNEILRKVISSIYNNDADAHKSFWIEGTYGTGKSHASAVIMHLMCDEVADIKEYVNDEYMDAKYDVLRNSIFDIRQKKRLFPVTMYGTSRIAHRDDLSLQMQKAIKEALEKAGIDIAVKTDFDTYVNHIENNPEFWDLILGNSPTLASVAPTRDKLIADLRNSETDTLTRAKDALRESGLDVRLELSNLANWFFEVQDKLAEQGTYTGLLLLWDEFTDVMTSDIGPSLLVSLQEIADITMHKDNNSYLFFISHPSALNSLKAEERDKTKGRYHYMKYNMEPVSAFKIMSRKFKIVGTENEYHNLTGNFFMQNDELLDIYSKGSTIPEETKKDIKKLFPLHPATANLATYYARQAGSSSRSVFEFLGDNKDIKDFLNDEGHYFNKETITAEYLWDYVVDEFNDNVAKFGAVTERYNTYKQHVANKGAEYLAVFKSILLLNALNNIANNETVTPNEENIHNLYKGTPMEFCMDEILAWINEQSIVQRTPTGVYSIQFSALPTKEIAEIRDQMLLTEFRYTSQIINFGEAANNDFGTYLKGVMRALQFKFYGIESTESTLLNKIENGRKAAKDYELFLAIMVARNKEELGELKETAEKAAKDERFQNIVFLVFDATFGSSNYDRFIEYQANAKCAQKHGFADQQKSHTDNALDMIHQWVKEMRRGVVTVYTREMSEAVSASKLASSINQVIAPYIFSSGAESLDIIKLRSSQTYWKKLSARDIVKTVLTFNTKEDICDRCKGPYMHISYLLQDSVDENLEWKPDIDPEHPLKKVCDFVDHKIKYADKQNNFNLAEKFKELTQPPYGLYQTYSGMGMFAFAMRKYANKIFDLNGKPRSAQHLIEDVVEVFKCWENGNVSQKVTFKFETKEEGELCKKFINFFGLRSFKQYSDISSLKDARWAISHEFIALKGYPLWSLKYANSKTPMVGDGIAAEDLETLVDNIVKICNEVGTNNPSMMTTTLELMKRWEFEFKDMLKDESLYKNGFINFLKSDTNVNLQDNQVEDAVTYIKQHVQSEIGTWKENEVVDALKNWKLSLMPVEPPTPPYIPPVEPPIVPPSPKKEKIEKTRSKVSSMSHERLKSAVDKIIALGYEDVLNIILGE